jgi:hydrogenase maturation protease
MKKITDRKDSKKKTICVAGIGNTLRADDGVGALVCELLEEKNMEGVSIIVRHQLDIGLTEELTKFDNVIFVDASLEEETFSFKQLSFDIPEPQSLSHHINAAVLARLANTLYPTGIRFYICAIKGNDFEMGNNISEKTMNNALEAVSFLTDWIQSNI